MMVMLTGRERMLAEYGVAERCRLPPFPRALHPFAVQIATKENNHPVVY
jgi:hypothetical protein